jgi:hypothetical protein
VTSRHVFFGENSHLHKKALPGSDICSVTLLAGVIRGPSSLHYVLPAESVGPSTGVIGFCIVANIEFVCEF